MILRAILEFILVVVLFRFVVAVFRAMAGSRPRGEERGEASPRPRGRVIDVEYTEEKRGR